MTTSKAKGPNFIIIFPLYYCLLQRHGLNYIFFSYDNYSPKKNYAKGKKFSYNYRNLESDAVVGAFTDSDFKGGGTDGSGPEISVSYPFAKKIKLSVTHFFNETALENGRTYHRTFVDFSFGF